MENIGERYKMMIDFKLTEEEVKAFEAMKSSFESSIGYIEDLLEKNERGNADCSELSWVYVDHVRGLDRIADYNTLWDSRNVIDNCYKRYQDAGGEA